MAKNLTTLFLFKQYADLETTVNDDKKIVRLIDHVGQAIAAYCNRTFELTTYREWYDGTGTPRLTLNQFPVTRLLGASSDTVNVGSITNTSAKWASVTLRSAVLYLDAISSAGAETNDSVNISDNATIGDLETSVDALGNGWSMTVESGKSTEASVLLRPFDGVWTVSPDDVDLDIADQTDAVRLVEGSNQQIEYPSLYHFPQGSQNVFVWYKAGYTLPVDNTGHTDLTTAGNVPDDLTLIANEIVSAVFNASGEEFAGAASERIGNYSYTLGSGAQAMIQSAIKEHGMALSTHRSSRVV